MWSWLGELGAAGTLTAIDEVLEELQKKEDGAHAWAKKNLTVVPIDAAIQGVVADIMKAHPRLVDNRRNRSQGDPFVIALARVRGFTVVTGEKASNNPEKPRIPDVCAAMNVKCINMLGLFREQNWKM